MIEGMKWGIKNYIDKTAKESVDSFVKEHPIATGVMVVMGVVIFAQHVELKCLTATRSQTVFVL